MKNEMEMVMVPAMCSTLLPLPKNIAVLVCILSLVGIASLGVATVEIYCLATSALPSAEGDSCDGGQKTFGYR